MLVNYLLILIRSPVYEVNCNSEVFYVQFFNVQIMKALLNYFPNQHLTLFRN